MRRGLGCLVALVLGASPVACNGIQPPPPDLVTIRGQVTKHGVGVPNAKVWGIDRAAHANGADAGPTLSFPTDNTGHFALYNFGTTYDVVVQEDVGSPVFTIVSGLTRRDPVISLDETNAPTRAAHVAVTWTTPPPDGATIAYFFSPPNYPGIHLFDVAPAGPSLGDGLTVRWSGGFSTTGFVQALVYSTDASGVASSFSTTNGAYGWFTDKGTVPATFTLQSVDTSPANLQIQAPDGYATEDIDVGLDFGAGGTPVYFSHVASPGPSVQLALPNVPANRVNVRGTAKKGGETATSYALGNSTPGQTASLAMQFFAASQLSSPDDGATNVDPASSFAWDGTGLNEVSFTSADKKATSLRVLTSDASISLATITSLTGIGLTGGATYSWTTRRWPDFPSTDVFDGAETDRTTAKVSTGVARTFTVAAP